MIDYLEIIFGILTVVFLLAFVIGISIGWYYRPQKKVSERALLSVIMGFFTCTAVGVFVTGFTLIVWISKLLIFKIMGF